MKRNNVLQKAEAVVYGRGEVEYGPPAVNMQCIADLWTAYLRRRGLITEEVTARDVAILMVLLKTSRDANKPSEDNLVDIAGYAGVADRVAKES